MKPLEFLSPSDLEAIHRTSLRVLSEVGVHFPDPQARETFQRAGYRREGERIFFSEDQIWTALEAVPDSFTLQARSQDRNVTVGDGQTLFTPGYGAPFLIDPEEGKRIPGLNDYQQLIKLNQVLPHQDLIGYLLVEPQDVPTLTAHLHMLRAAVLYGDKPFLGSAENGQAARDTLEICRILYGSLEDQYVTLGLISALSPLAYSPEMTEAVRVFARGNQPLMFANLVMAGSTGPITLPGTIAQQNAELLAGISLAQLYQPGLPVLYGTTSTNIDMRTGALAIGSPELSLITASHGQLARYYGLPSRGGGCLTDASTTDAQAGSESTFGLLAAVNSGLDFVLHAAGIMSSYLAFSYPKMILDDELCGMVRRYQGGLDVTEESLAWGEIQAVGPGGHYLNQPLTRQRCRTAFWMPEVFDRSGLETWWGEDRRSASQRASQRCSQLLEEYQQPDLERVTARQITAYLQERENRPA